MLGKVFILMVCFSVSVLENVSASSVDQEQLLHSSYNDWGSGCGQVFVAGETGWLTGIQMVIEDNNNPGTIEIYLWHADEQGKPTGEKLATAYFNKSSVTSPTADWYTALFDHPYAQIAGERLAFTIELMTSGTTGWNEYGYVRSNSYQDGFRIGFYGGGSFYTYPDEDWAFKSLVIPQPELMCAMDSSSSFILSVPASEPDAMYVLESAHDPNGVWSSVTSLQGTGSVLNWNLSGLSSGQSVYRIQVAP